MRPQLCRPKMLILFRCQKKQKTGCEVVSLNVSCFLGSPELDRPDRRGRKLRLAFLNGHTFPSNTRPVPKKPGKNKIV